ncbi:MAG TPA: hypothetical protein DEB06_06655 [Phycisphaerales bacterium]|nr:hypothetical protein [Phycisphaerales bacterium]
MIALSVSFARSIGLGLVALLLAAAPVSGQDVWRVAGTFNGWNTADPAWTLTADPADANRFILDKAFPVGVHRFKFVKNGDWAQGHFGAGPGPDTLEQPGVDIPLQIRADAEYRLTLKPAQRVWSISVTKIDAPVLVVRTLGQARVNREFVIDAGQSVRVDTGAPPVVTVSSPTDPLRTIHLAKGIGARVIPQRKGPLTLEVKLADQSGESVQRINLDVKPAFALRYAHVSDRSATRHFFEPQADGTEIALVSVPPNTLLEALEITRDGARVLYGTDLDAPAGVHALIVEKGELLKGESPASALHPGDWRRFALTPPFPTDRVFLVGDFNNWAGAGQPGAIEMLSRADGSFSAIVNLPQGTHRYQFQLDGGVQIPDPSDTSPRILEDGRRVSVISVGPQPKDHGQARPNHINELAVRHNPASPIDLRPIHAGMGLVDLSIVALPGDAERAFVTIRTTDDGAERLLRAPMSKGPDLAGFDRYTARVMTGSPQASYTFTLEDGSASFTTPTFSATLDPHPPVPAWAMGAVWYQIFPERFRNGNPLNDPHGPGVFNKPWTDDWATVSPAEEQRWREVYNTPAPQPFPPRKGGPLFHVVWDRRYGGDLQGIEEKFAYLRDLGVTALYMNPVFEAESMHKYDATDYRHIDDNLSWPAEGGRVSEQWSFPDEPNDPASWTWTPGDRYLVERFLPQAKKHGIRVVLDGVFNHTGLPFWAFADIQKNGDKSIFKDWYFVKFDASGRLQSWESWFNTGSLPKFRQTAEGDLVAPVKQHIFDITRRWMDPNGDGDPSDGIDGWRLDVALDIGPPFWKDWRALVKSINPEAVIIAEIWDDATPHLKGRAFDTQMHYPFAKAVTDWLGVRPGMTSAELAQRLAAAFGDDAPQTALIHQNLFGSHDTDRFVSMLQNPGRAYDEGNRPQDHDYPYKDTKPSRDTYQRSLLGVALQATYTGAPMVYYGDEVGMWGADDPTDRKPFPWPDLGRMANPDENADFDLHKEYTRWLTLRRDPRAGPVLNYGSTRHLESGDPDVFAFERALNATRVIVVLNRKAAPWSAAGLIPKGTTQPSVPANSASYWVIEEGSAPTR